jgi:hypothetical protein
MRAMLGNRIMAEQQKWSMQMPIRSKTKWDNVRVSQGLLNMTIMGRAQAPDFWSWSKRAPDGLNGWHRPDLLGLNGTIPEGTVGSDVVEMSEASNKALNRK